MLLFSNSGVDFEVAQKYLPAATWGCGQENAYLTLFKAILQTEPYQPGYRYGNLKYLALNVKGVDLADTTKLEEAIQAYCDKNGYTLLPYDVQLLIEEGYLEPRHIWYEDGEEFIDYWFENGAFINWGGTLTKNTFAAGGGGWRSDGSAFFCDYEVRRIGCIWFVANRGPIAIA